MAGETTGVQINPDKGATLAGIFAAIPYVAALFGVVIPPAAAEGITALGLLVLGWLTNKK